MYMCDMDLPCICIFWHILNVNNLILRREFINSIKCATTKIKKRKNIIKKTAELFNSFARE